MSSTEPSAKPPMPVPDELTQFFWDGVARHELCIQRCQTCGHYIHYPKTICRFCQSRDLAGERVSGKATLYSWTIATQPFHPFWVDKIPYTLATVELVEQPRLMFMSQVIDCPEEELEGGLPLEVAFVEMSSELTLPLFRPARG
ncbi:MAG: OB-fold domain-containing protein [Acidimicrobiia bacterium]